MASPDNTRWLLKRLRGHLKDAKKNRQKKRIELLEKTIAQLERTLADEE